MCLCVYLDKPWSYLTLLSIRIVYSPFYSPFTSFKWQNQFFLLIHSGLATVLKFSIVIIKNLHSHWCWLNIHRHDSSPDSDDTEARLVWLMTSGAYWFTAAVKEVWPLFTHEEGQSLISDWKLHASSCNLMNFPSVNSGNRQELDSKLMQTTDGGTAAFGLVWPFCAGSHGSKG